MTLKKQTLNVTFWISSLTLVIFSIINQKYVHYDHILLQFLVTLIAFAVGVYLFFITTQGVSFYKYWLSAVVELKKVTWPGKKQTMQVTLAVIAMVVVTGLLLWTVDSILIKLVKFLLQRRW